MKQAPKSTIISNMDNLSERERSVILYLLKPTRRANTVRRIGRNLKLTASQTANLIKGLEKKHKIVKTKINGRAYEIKLITTFIKSKLL